MQMDSALWWQVAFNRKGNRPHQRTIFIVGRRRASVLNVPKRLPDRVVQAGSLGTKRMSLQRLFVRINTLAYPINADLFPIRF